MIAASRGVSVDGRVLGHEVRTMDDSVAYHPIVEFADENGVRHRFTSVAGGSEEHPEVGALVRVRYLPADPKIAYIQSFLHMWAAPLGFLALALAVFGVIWHYQTYAR